MALSRISLIIVDSFSLAKSWGTVGGITSRSLFVLQLLDNIQYFSSKVLYNDIVKDQCSYSHQFSLVKLETTIRFVLTNLFIMLPQKHFLRHHFNSLSLNHPPSWALLTTPPSHKYSAYVPFWVPKMLCVFYFYQFIWTKLFSIFTQIFQNTLPFLLKYVSQFIVLDHSKEYLLFFDFF